MGGSEIFSLTSSSSSSSEEEEDRHREDRDREEEEDCIVSANNDDSSKKKRKKKNKEDEKRGGPSYGSCSFPMSRIKRLMKSEAVLDFRTTPDFVFLVNKATERFLEQFVEDAYAVAVRDRRKSLSYEHLSSVVTKEKRYEFLSDYVPEKIRAKDALVAKLSNER